MIFFAQGTLCGKKISLTTPKGVGLITQAPIGARGTLAVNKFP
jgi:hypothetical protein